jgi:hypothetical protein
LEVGGVIYFYFYILHGRFPTRHNWRIVVSHRTHGSHDFPKPIGAADDCIPRFRGERKYALQRICQFEGRSRPTSSLQVPRKLKDAYSGMAFGKAAAATRGRALGRGAGMGGAAGPAWSRLRRLPGLPASTRARSRAPQWHPQEISAQLLGERGRPLGLPGGPNWPNIGSLWGTQEGHEISSRRVDRGA